MWVGSVCVEVCCFLLWFAVFSLFWFRWMAPFSEVFPVSCLINSVDWLFIDLVLLFTFVLLSGCMGALVNWLVW